MEPLHQLGDLPDYLVHELAKQIIAKRAVGITELEGKSFEQMLCNILKVNWKGSNNGLRDVLAHFWGVECWLECKELVVG